MPKVIAAHEVRHDIAHTFYIHTLHSTPQLSKCDLIAIRIRYHQRSDKFAAASETKAQHLLLMRFATM